MIQIVILQPVSQNSYLSSKLNPTSQNKSMHMLSFQNRALDIKILKIYASEIIMLTSKNESFNGSSFANSDTAIGFLVSK